MEDENFFCSDCQIMYNSSSNYKKHITKRHPTKIDRISTPEPINRSLQCVTCGQNFKTNRSLNSHKKNCQVESSVKIKTNNISNILEDETIECSDCELEFDDLGLFKQHMRDHRDNRIRKNSKSRNSSLSKRSPKVDIKKVKEENIYTPQNNYSASCNEFDTPIRKSNRSRKIISYAHLVESESESDDAIFFESKTEQRKHYMKQRCKECNVQCDNQLDLEKHIQEHHQCKVEKQAENKKSWQKNKHNFKKHICQICSTNYKDASCMRKHIRKFHPKKWLHISSKLHQKRLKNSETVFTCRKCQKKYANIGELRRHVRKFHSTTPNELTSSYYKKKPRDTVKKLTCNVCQIKYCTLISLRKHIKTQHPDSLPELMPMLYKKKLEYKRDIACSECDMKYSNMSGLRKHTRKNHPNKLVELAPRLYTFKRNMAKNILKNSKSEFLSELIDTLDRYKCNICESSYSNISNLRKHLRKFHPEKLSDIAPLLKDDRNFQYPCNLCPKRFHCLRNFKYHQRKCHPEIAPPPKRTTKHNKINRCPLCGFENTERKTLLQHFKNDHDIEVFMTPVEATTLEEFAKWKDSFEKETNTRFVKEYHFSCTTHDVVSYICHRSGYYNPKGKGLRHMKAQGSNKINGYCPAAIKLKKFRDGTVKVTFCGTHIGHTTDLNHLHLTPKERQIIADKIAMNIPFTDILESMKETASESDLKRIHMLSKKDLYNIKSSFHLASPKTIKPPRETLDFEIWIENTKNNEDCVIFHKPQGQYLPEHPNLKEDDFVIILMNSTQRDKLKKFGHDTIYLDRSFDLNCHQFELTSLLVLNETQEGYPCAFLVSNRSDEEIMMLFFHYIRTNVGVISTKMFMSDMVTYFYSAWASIMGEVESRSYSTWLIAHSWKRKLFSLKPKDKQEIVMNRLNEVLKQDDILTFKAELETAVQYFDSKLIAWDITNYLTEQYLKNDDLWPSKDNIYKTIMYNSHFERMHKTFNYLFLNGKNAKHFGKALGDIMRFLKDKLFDKTILINRGKINNKMKIAIFRHKLSLHSNVNIEKTDAGWQIPSSETSETYTVTEILPFCRCEFICPECKTCIHRYLCSCLDSLVKWNMCKHIHLLCRHLNSLEPVKRQQNQQPPPRPIDESRSIPDQHNQSLVFLKPHHVQFDEQQLQVELVKQQTELEFGKQDNLAKQAQHLQLQQCTEQIEYVKQPRQINFIKQSSQMEHVQVQHIQVGNHVGQVDQVEGTYIYCNEPNQREMDAILAEVNICNLETVQVTQIPTSCTIQIPTTCSVVPQVAQITTVCPSSFGEVVDTKEFLKIKFLKLLEEASSPTELEVVQKMLASIAPTLEVIKGNTNNHQVLFPL